MENLITKIEGTNTNMDICERLQHHLTNVDGLWGKSNRMKIMGNSLNFSKDEKTNCLVIGLNYPITDSLNNTLIWLTDKLYAIIKSEKDTEKVEGFFWHRNCQLKSKLFEGAPHKSQITVSDVWTLYHQIRDITKPEKPQKPEKPEKPQKQEKSTKSK